MKIDDEMLNMTQNDYSSGRVLMKDTQKRLTKNMINKHRKAKGPKEQDLIMESSNELSIFSDEEEKTNAGTLQVKNFKYKQEDDKVKLEFEQSDLKEFEDAII